MSKVPESVIKELNDITIKCISSQNFDYLIDKINFVEDLYIKCNNGQEVRKKISRWTVMRIMITSPDLIDKKKLSKDKLEEVIELYNSAKLSM